MLKRRTGLLFLLLLFCLSCISAQAVTRADGSSFDDFSFSALDGYTTVLTDLAGKEYSYSGVLRSASLEDCAAVSRLAEYAIYHGEDVILSVQLHDITPEENGQLNSSTTPTEASNGYYSVSFAFGESSRYETFLTGLTQENVTKVETAVLDAIWEDDFLDIEDIGFIDVEKAYIGDYNLCWAAATANVLHYTGWGEEAGFGSTDYIFDTLVEAFTDDGGNTDYGINWFFNGYNPGQDPAYYNGAKAKDSGAHPYSTFNGFLSDYNYEQYCSELNVGEQPWTIQTVCENLKDGYGANLNFGYYDDSGERTGGHAITMWGYVVDTTVYNANSFCKDAYVAVIVSDSDSDVTWGSNRRTAPNVLQFEKITPVNYYNMDSWRIDSYSDGDYVQTIIDSIVTLAPYSEDAETDAGTHTIKNSVDLTTNYLALYTGTRGINTTYFAKDDTIYIYPSIVNIGGVSLEDTEISYRIDVYDADGKSAYAEKGSTEEATLTTNFCTDREEIPSMIEVGELDPGQYTVRFTIDSEKKIEEAYEGNNVYETEITVGTANSSSNTFSFSITPDYSRGNEDARLYLNTSGSLGYSVKQYVVQLNYLACSEGTGYITVYRGETLPEYVKLEAIGDAVDAMIWAIPADGEGYESCADSTNQPELIYYDLALDASETEFTPICVTDTQLNNGETFSFTVDNNSTAEDPDHQMHIMVSGYCIEREEWFEFAYLNDNWNYSERSDTYSLTSWDPDSWDEGVTLQPGSYNMYGEVEYDPCDEKGQLCNYASVYLGTLTVLADKFSTPVVNVTHSDDGERIGYSFETSAQSFTVVISLGTRETDLPELDSTTYYSYDSGIFSNSITVGNLAPETTYYYSVKVLDSSGTEAAESQGSFTTEAASTDEPQQEEPTVVYTLLAPGETELTMSYGTEGYYETFLPSEDGTWAFTFSGPDGSVLQIWDDEAEELSEPTYFTLDGETLNLEVKKGQAVRFYVHSMMAGEYTIEYQPTALSYAKDSDGLHLGVVASDEECCIVASYSKSGQMVNSVEVQGTGSQVISIPDKTAAKVRVFHFDKQTYSPIGTPEEFSLDGSSD